MSNLILAAVICRRAIRAITFLFYPSDVWQWTVAAFFVINLLCFVGNLFPIRKKTGEGWYYSDGAALLVLCFGRVRSRRWIVRHGPRKKRALQRD